MIKYFLGILLLIFGQSWQVEAQYPQTLKVMSYNIHIGKPPSADMGNPGTTDMGAIAEVINETNPDLVALQEVDVRTHRSGTDLHQAETLANLTDMHYYFGKALNRSGGDYGVAVLSRFPIQESRTVSLPVVKGSGAELRAAAITKISMPESPDIIFISTHFDHLEEKNRTLQAETLIEVLKEYVNHPILLAGDFNTQYRKGNKTMGLLTNQFEPGCMDCPPTFPSKEPHVGIDYIFLNKKAQRKYKVLNYEAIEGKYASDHLPVTMELELKTN